MNTQERSKLLKLIGKYETLITCLESPYFIYAVDNRPLVVITDDKILFTNAESPYFNQDKYRNIARKVNLMTWFVVNSSAALIRNVEMVDQSVIDSYLPINR